MKVKCSYGNSKGICSVNGVECNHAKEHKIINNCNKKICSPDFYGYIKTSCREKEN